MHLPLPNTENNLYLLNDGRNLTKKANPQKNFQLSIR